jgi:hypothetical protein
VDPQDVPAVLSLRLRVVDKTRHRKVKLYVEHCTREGGRMVHRALHRILLGVSDPDILVDHRDGDGLNCRRSNLRETDRMGNSQNASIRADNTSGYRGVTLRSPGRWQASIQCKGVRRYLGSFSSPEIAGEAYVVAARRLHGAFMRVR